MSGGGGGGGGYRSKSRTSCSKSSISVLEFSRSLYISCNHLLETGNKLEGDWGELVALGAEISS